MLVHGKNILYFVTLQILINFSNQSLLSKDTGEINDYGIDTITTETDVRDKQDYNVTDIDLKRSIEEKDSNKTLTELEGDKIKLYKEIMKSIDESVLLLENTNDTEAKRGIEFMKELKYQMKNINGTDSKLPRRDENGKSRRSLKEKKIKLTYEEIANLFKEKNKSALVFAKGHHYHDIDMKKKIDDWILQRQLEKQKILDYKKKIKGNGRMEKCPRYGKDKKKIKVNGKTRKRFRPCCRKCCKMSYMGCL